MNALSTLGLTLALMAGVGAVFAVVDRRRFAGRWFVVAMLLVVLDDALLTRMYGLLPRWIGGEWNWQGKLLALAATLLVAALPAFGWRRVGLTWRQRRGSLRACLCVAAIYAAFFTAIALAFPAEGASRETVAFQLTMPGLEEEPLYRGTLLFALDRAFAGRWRFAGVDWGWGALLSSLLFGLAHALSHHPTGFAFDPVAMALTAVPALLAVWLRYRSGSLVWPIALHNLGNSVGFLI